MLGVNEGNVDAVEGKGKGEMNIWQGNANYDREG